MTDTRSRNTQHVLDTAAVLLCVTTSDLFSSSWAMRYCNASGDAACPLSCDGPMNFIEQNLSAGLFPPCLERSLRGERIPVKTLHPFPELGIIIVTHEDRGIFSEPLDVLA